MINQKINQRIINLENLVLRVTIKDIRNEVTAKRYFEDYKKEITFIVKNLKNYEKNKQDIGREIQVRTYVYDVWYHKLWGDDKYKRYYTDNIPCDFLSYNIKVDMKPQNECILLGVMDGFKEGIASFDEIKKRFNIWHMDYYLYMYYDGIMRLRLYSHGILKKFYNETEITGKEKMRKLIKRQSTAHPYRPRVIFANENICDNDDNLSDLVSMCEEAGLTIILLNSFAKNI